MEQKTRPDDNYLYNDAMKNSRLLPALRMMLVFSALVPALLLVLTSCTTPSKEISRSAIASAHPLATAAGMEVLKQGGNAFDAAVAITALIGVVEPYGSGIGGGGFWLLHRNSDGFQTMVDGREKAPGAAHRDMYLDEKGDVRKGASINGPLAAGIPGVPAAMVHIANKYGKLPLSVSMSAAINVARDGFKVDKQFRRYAKMRLKTLKKDPTTTSIYLVNNEVPPLGYLLKQPNLAKTLERIANKGTAGFYEGEFAQKLVSGVKAAGGIWSLDDLKNYKIVERKPIVASYHNMKLISASPPSSGGIALAGMLRMLDQYDLDKLSDADQKHMTIEIMRRAYRDRAEFLGDTDFVDVPVTKLTSKKHAQQLIKSINMDQATLSSELEPVKTPTGAGADTTHFSIIDKDGNRVAATLSVNYLFGSCFMVPGTGFLLNDEMDDFSAKPGVPNAYGLVGAEANSIEPGKRMLSSMSPTFIESDRGVAILGTPGGSRIITMLLLGLLEYEKGADAEKIVARPRFHHQYLPDMVMYEDKAFTEDTEEELSLRGHTMKKQMPPYGGGFGSYGNMQAIVWDKNKKKLTAASDKRGIGSSAVNTVINVIDQ
jgi:gamma-glutamyltranspeptidase/glutathione hydrolase